MALPTEVGEGVGESTGLVQGPPAPTEGLPTGRGGLRRGRCITKGTGQMESKGVLVPGVPVLRISSSFVPSLPKMSKMGKPSTTFRTGGGNSNSRSAGNKEVCGERLVSLIILTNFLLV